MLTSPDNCLSTSPDNGVSTSASGNMSFLIKIADYQNSQDAIHILELLDIYARDIMGGSEPLTEHARQTLIPALAKLPYALSILCYVDAQPVGLLNAFESFSTFKCKPLLNIHDVIVAPNFRGMGISQMLLEKVEQIARAKGCCKITLEVLEGNKSAQAAYQKFGFSGYQLDPLMGNALFWQKNL